MNRRKLLLRGYTFKEITQDRFGEKPARTEAEKMDDRSTVADVNAFHRAIRLFFVFFSTLVQQL